MAICAAVPVCVHVAFSVTSVLCPCGWCCIHPSVTQKQMSLGRWGAADCRGDRAVAGWRCLRPAVPSRWELRSLSAVLFISLPPTPPYLLPVFSYCVSLLQRQHQISCCVIAIKCKHFVKCFTSCKHIRQLKLFVLLANLNSLSRCSLWIVINLLLQSPSNTTVKPCDGKICSEEHRQALGLSVPNYRASTFHYK